MEGARKVGGGVCGLDIEVTNYKENMVRGDAHFLPFKDESFDSIFAGEIIEHLTNPTQFLKEIERILKRDGVLVITTPNIHSLTYIRKILFRRDAFHISFRTSACMGLASFYEIHSNCHRNGDY